MKFVPDDFVVPVEFVADRFRLEPLGAEHNARDHVAWMTSIDHIRATPGFSGGWPPPDGMSLEDNLADLEGHAEEFVRREAFAYSVLDSDGKDVIGCLYIKPDPAGDHEAIVKSWVRAEDADLDQVLVEVVAEWLARTWPFRDVLYR